MLLARCVHAPGVVTTVLLNTASASTVPVPNAAPDGVTLNEVAPENAPDDRPRIATGYGVRSIVNTPVAANWIPNVPLLVLKSAPKLMSTISASAVGVVSASAYSRTARALVSVVDETATSFMSYISVPVGLTVTVGAVDVP